MKNKMSDLHDHLFMQLERLNDESLKGEALASEIERSKAVTSVASQIVSNANLALKAEELRLEYQGAKLPGALTDALRD